MYDNNDDERWERGWRKFERKMDEMARRFGQASAWGRGAWEGIGENFRMGRMIASGDLRVVALYLIEQQPRHGYDIIKAIEDRSAGLYSPSPGVVYPALTFLEEAGHVTAVADGNKKLYTITEQGRAHLEENREAIRQTLEFLEKAGERMNRWRESTREGFAGGETGPGPDMSHRPREHDRDRDMAGVVPELNAARRELKAALAAAARRSEDAQRQAAAILGRAAADLRRLSDDEDIDL